MSCVGVHEPTEICPECDDGREHKVLVGRIYKSMNTTWHEWADKSFDEVCEAVGKRREDGKVNDYPDEIIEVIVVRRAVIKGEVRVEEMAS